MQQEYYIREPDTEDSRGPFTVDQLASLVEAGRINKETYIYDVENEAWDEAGNISDLKDALFPEKKKLNLKPKETVARLNVEDTEAAPISVDDMLAAAEGRTKETRHRFNLDQWREHLAYVAMHVAAIGFLLSGAALIATDSSLLFGFDLEGLFTQNPLPLIGVIDLGIAVVLFLRTTAIYPLVRFRAALGAGFLGLLFLSYGDPWLMAAAVCGSIGLHFCTLFANLTTVLVSTLLTLGGMGGLAFLILTT